MRDLLADLDLAGGEDLDLSRGGGAQAVGGEGESHLRDATEGAMPHEVRVRRGVQQARLQV